MSDELSDLIKQRRAAQGATPDPVDSLIAARRAALVPAAPKDATAARLGSKPVPLDPGGAIVAGVRGASQGATFGFADEMAAGIDALKDKLTGGSGTYASHLAENRAKLAASQQAHPVAEIGGEIVGGLAGGNAAGTLLGLTGKAAQVGEVATKGRRLVNVGKTATAAAAGGGLAAAGTATGDLTDRLAAVPRGAAFGAGTALGLSGAGSIAEATGIPTVLKRLLPRASASSPTGRILGSVGVQSADDLAKADILKQLGRGRLSLSDLEAKAAGAHPDQMLVNLGGDAMVERAGGAYATPSRGAVDIKSALEAQDQRLPKATREAAGSALGVQRGNTVLDAQTLASERRAAASPLYDKAYSAPPIDDPEVLATMQLPAFKAAYKRAQRIAKLEGVSLPELTSTSEVGGESVTAQNPLSVQAIDYTKRGLDDLIESKMRSGGIGKTEARALRQRLAGVLERTDAAVPDYAAARSTFAGHSSVMDAHELGQQFPKIGTDELAAMWPSLSETERTAYRRGALASIEDAVRGKTDGQNPVRMFRDDVMRDNLKIILPDQAAHDAFYQAIDQIHGMKANSNSILANSKTASRQAQQAEGVGGGGLDALATSALNPTGLLRNLANSLGAQRLRGLNEQQVNALAPLLTAKGEDMTKVIQGLWALAEREAAKAGSFTRSAGQIAGAASARH